MAIERLFINEGVKEAEVKRFLRSELKSCGIGDIQIKRTPLVTRIVVVCDRPAMVIGRKGKSVKRITDLIEKNYRLEKPEIEVKKVENPNLDPNVVAYRISSSLERGNNPRRVGYTTLQSIMSAGAKGAEIVMGGKMVGKGEKARVLKMKAGYMKKSGYPALHLVGHGYSEARCKPGVVGVSVHIVPGNTHFPDEFSIVEPVKTEIQVEEKIVPVETLEAAKRKAEEAAVGAEKAVEKEGAKGEKKKGVEKAEAKKGVAKAKKGEEPKEHAVVEEKAKKASKELKAKAPKETKEQGEPREATAAREKTPGGAKEKALAPKKGAKKGAEKGAKK